jgi:queuosine biosynthesis protein QueC
MKKLVLMSGGLDSTAALMWALTSATEADEVQALFFYYGQPAGQNECARSLAVTRELGVKFTRCDVASVFTGTYSGLFSPRYSKVVDGLDTAFVPVRNALLITAAAARALTFWPNDVPVELVVGFNQEDARGFPDCSDLFVAAITGALNIGLGRGEDRIKITAPWSAKSKRDVVAWARSTVPQWMPLIEQSWSCYREQGPCGVCTACVVRAGAF